MLYKFDDSVKHGVVDLYFNPWSNRDIRPLISHLGEINPGLINRVGFEYGGPSQYFINAVGELVIRIRSVLPRVLIGGGLNEAIHRSYKETLQCGGAMGNQSFQFSELVTGSQLGADANLVDITKSRAQDFYACIGQMLIERGVTYLHFEAPTLVLSASPSRDSAANGYLSVRDRLITYATQRHLKIYFSGDPTLAKILQLDGIYMPSRLFHVSIPSYFRYQRRIAESGSGVGYTYALSFNIVDDTVGSVPKRTKVFFYIDNWDESQDDLRRFSELDGVNRRRLLIESAITAGKGGAYFIPPLEHCEGCVNANHVGDKCEILANGKSEYDAYECGDFPTISDALSDERAQQFEGRVRTR
jgi:hypothetical protein